MGRYISCGIATQIKLIAKDVYKKTRKIYYEELIKFLI